MENSITIKSAEELKQDIAFFGNPVKIEKVLYTGKTHTSGGRDGGKSQSDDRRLDVAFTTPGKKGDGTNPEQMFAAGWSACFISAMRLAAGKMKVTVPDEIAVDAEVDLSTNKDGAFLQARLYVSLPGLDRATAMAIIEAAHQTCPYSKATSGNINVTISLV
jgi:lipoyl-dependent peroxiredoxin